MEKSWHVSDYGKTFRKTVKLSKVKKDTEQENFDPGITIKTGSGENQMEQTGQTVRNVEIRFEELMEQTGQKVRNVEIRFEEFEGFDRVQIEFVKILKEIMQLHLDNISSLRKVHSIKAKTETKKIGKILNKLKVSNNDALRDVTDAAALLMV